MSTTPLTKLDRPTLKALDAEALAALRPIMEKYGLSVTNAGGSFSETEATLKFKVSLPQAVRSASAQETWNLFCGGYGLKPEHFNRTFNCKGKTYQIVGIDPSRPKNCVKLVEFDTGKDYKSSATHVRQMLTMQEVSVA